MNFSLKHFKTEICKHAGTAFRNGFIWPLFDPYLTLIWSYYDLRWPNSTWETIRPENDRIWPQSLEITERFKWRSKKKNQRCEKRFQGKEFFKIWFSEWSISDWSTNFWPIRTWSSIHHIESNCKWSILQKMF